MHAGRPWSRGTLSAGLLAGLLNLPLATPPVGAFTLEEFQFSDPVKAEEFKRLTEELRCLVCQNQNIADSNAELAQDLRREIRGMIKDGKSDKEIIDFMVTRYGDFVLYRPPVQGNTLLLWGGPIVLLILGIIALVRYQRRRAERVAAEDKPLSAEQASRADALLKELDNK